jgi:hypothetical protein
MRQGSSNKYMPMPLKESKRGLFIFKWLIKNLRLKSKRKILRKKIKENDEQVDLRYTLLKKEFLEGFSENFIRKSIYSYRERLKKKIFFLNYEYSLIG